MYIHLILRYKRYRVQENPNDFSHNKAFNVPVSIVQSGVFQEGVRELDQEKLPDLLELKYHGVSDAAAELGSVAGIRDVFIGFQRYLYE